MKQITLVTNAPSRSGLAYFHYLAFRDIYGKGVCIVDNGRSGYGRSLIERLISRARIELRVDRKSQYRSLLKSIGDNPTNSVVIFYGMASLSACEIRELHSKGVSLYVYFSDSPFTLSAANWGDIRKALPLFKCVFTPTNDLVPVYFQNGAKRVVRIPFGYCRYTHLRSQPQVPGPDGNIYYFGTYSPMIEDWLDPLSKFPLIIHGHDWGKALSRSLRLAACRSIALDAFMAKAASGQLVVNFLRTNHGACHSMKTFELPAAGACVLSNRTAEQLHFFPEDSGVGYFDTKDEMLALLRKLLPNPDEIRRRILLRGKWLSGQTYHERVQGMLNEICGC